MNRFEELIEKAKEDSKQDFIRFVKGIYNVEDYVFEHLWKVPVIAPYEADTIIESTLTTKSEDDIIEILDESINEELGASDGCFIYLDKLAVNFEIEEIEEWKNKIERGEVKQDCNAIIVYNERELRKLYKEAIKKVGQGKTQEEQDNKFLEYVKKVITHERCHLNSNYLTMEKEGSEEYAGYVNAASLTDIEVDGITDDKSMDTAIINKYNNERNEVLVDTLSQIMSKYEEGNTIEEVLYKILEERGGVNQYEEIDDTEVLAIYTLFPDELTEWMIFGAYDYIRENKLRTKIIEVCGTDKIIPKDILLQKVGEYVSKQKEGELSEKQIEMLGMLGVETKKINKEEIKNVATSEKAMEALEGCFADIQNIMEKATKEEQEIN